MLDSFGPHFFISEISGDIELIYDGHATGQFAGGFDFDIMFARGSTKRGIERYAHAHGIGQRNASLACLPEEGFDGGAVAAYREVRDGIS